MSLTDKTPTEPGARLYQLVKAGFIAQGTSLSVWCRKNGSRIENARSCLTGTWNGPKGKAFRAKIVAEALGAQQQPAAHAPSLPPGAKVDNSTASESTATAAGNKPANNCNDNSQSDNAEVA